MIYVPTIMRMRVAVFIAVLGLLSVSVPSVSSAYFTEGLKTGSVHPDVAELRIFLVTHGYRITSTGEVFNTEISTALKKFQTDHPEIGETSGLLTARTRSAINNIMQGEGIVLGASARAPFTIDLRYGMSHGDVKRLQEFLNDNGFTVTSFGPGSKGNETMYFGSATQAALIKYQEANASAILAPLGLTQGTGLFLSKTREHINR